MTFSFSSVGGMGMEPEIFNYEISIAGQIQSGSMQTIGVMAQTQFMDLVQQIANDSRPCRVKFSKTVRVWNEFTDEWRELENSVEFTNIAFGG